MDKVSEEIKKLVKALEHLNKLAFEIVKFLLQIAILIELLF